MSNVVEPRRAADQISGATRGPSDDGELTSLVRRWMATGSRAQGRGRRESILRLAPGPPDAEVDDLIHVGEPPEPRTDEPGKARLVPVLPRRAVGEELERAGTIAVLVDARRTPGAPAAALLAQVAGRGNVGACRAYADWSRSDVGDWVRQVRSEGLYSFHQFPDDDEQVLVAMTIDALDLARDAAVEEVVIAGDTTSMLPLVHRLHAEGVRVVVVGPAHTPHEVRATCDEFLLADALPAGGAVLRGRHRA
jgi:hypothetical protein